MKKRNLKRREILKKSQIFIECYSIICEQTYKIAELINLTQVMRSENMNFIYALD